MAHLNKLILMGRLGADPVEHRSEGGVVRVHFPLATSRRVKGVDDEGFVSATEWHRVVAWGRTAEFARDRFRKGDAVFLEGYIKSRKYNDDQGIKRTSVEVHAERLQFLAASPKRAGIAEAELSSEKVEGENFEIDTVAPDAMTPEVMVAQA